MPAIRRAPSLIGFALLITLAPAGSLRADGSPSVASATPANPPERRERITFECSGLPTSECESLGLAELQRVYGDDPEGVRRIVVTCEQGDPCRTQGGASLIAIHRVDGTGVVSFIDR